MDKKNFKKKYTIKPEPLDNLSNSSSYFCNFKVFLQVFQTEKNFFQTIFSRHQREPLLEKVKKN